MFGGGFWGTPREDEWRRRKEREEQRTDEVREEERRIRVNLAERHEREMEEKRQVLNVAVGLLGDARYDAQAAKRRRRNNDGDGAATDANAVNDSRSSSTAVEGQPGNPGEAQPRVKTEDCSSIAPIVATSNTDVTTADEERQAEESVRENLLALSYAMFDSLYGTRSFDPRAFVSFLLRQGETSLAEQIGLAAIEKSYGDPGIVKFVLNDLVPESTEPNELLKAVEQRFSSRSMKSEGKNALIEWQVNRGDTEAAFEAALLFDDEHERLNKALPLATTKERKQKLTESCDRLLGKDIIGMFEGEEWHDFMLSVLPVTRPENYYQTWEPPVEAYISHAVHSMDVTRGFEVVQRVVEAVALKQVEQISSVGDYRNPYPSQKRYHPDDVKKDREKCMMSLFRNGKNAYDRTLDVMSRLEKAFGLPNVQVEQNLERLGVDPYRIVAEQIKGTLELPPRSECTTSHGTFKAIFGCKTCRSACISLAIELGVLRALRQHPITSNSSPFLRIGFPASPDNLVQVATPGRSNEMANIAKDLLGDENAETYCAFP